MVDGSSQHQHERLLNHCLQVQATDVEQANSKQNKQLRLLQLLLPASVHRSGAGSVWGLGMRLWCWTAPQCVANCCPPPIVFALAWYTMVFSSVVS